MSSSFNRHRQRQRHPISKEPHFTSELTHIFLCAVLKLLEIALQAHFSIKDTLTISECHNERYLLRAHRILSLATFIYDKDTY